jgi:DNA primase
MDPDDLIKSQGAGAMKAVLDGAVPMVKLLWQREIEGRSFDSPERKAALDKSLRAHLKRIADPSIRSHYGEDIKQLRLELFGQGVRPFKPYTPRAPGQKGRFGPAIELPPMASTKGSALATGSTRVEEQLREAVILATLIVHPGLIRRFESALERVVMTHDDHADLRRILLAHRDDDAALLHGFIAEQAPAALAALMARPHVAIAPPVRNQADTDLATLCLAEELAKLDAHRGARREIEEAVEDMSGLADEGLTWRLTQAAAARHKADHPDREDAADLGEDRTALSNHLQSLIDSKVWEKKNH